MLPAIASGGPGLETLGFDIAATHLARPVRPRLETFQRPIDVLQSLLELRFDRQVFRTFERLAAGVTGMLIVGSQVARGTGLLLVETRLLYHAFSQGEETIPLCFQLLTDLLLLHGCDIPAETDLNLTRALGPRVGIGWPRRAEGGKNMARYDFTGKVALVTGGASGIGKACADAFAAGGAAVVIADYDEEGAKAAEEISANGATASFFKVDVSQADQCEAMVEHSVSTHGGLHIAVNNAGIGGPQSPSGEYPIDGWDQVIGINLSGVFYGMRYEIPAMLEAGGGSIINMASILGSVGFANSVAYVAAKHGVVGMTKSAALEYSAQGVRINSVGPAFINTPLIQENLDDEMRQGLVSVHPIGRLGESEEVANLVAFLGSDDASFCTGGYYLVDGAYTAQ